MKLFEYSEKKICEATGLSRIEAKKLRLKHLEKGKDWKNLRRQGIYLTEAGAIKIMDFAGFGTLAQSVALGNITLSGGEQSTDAGHASEGHAADGFRSQASSPAQSLDGGVAQLGRATAVQGAGGSNPSPSIRMIVRRIPPNPKVVLAHSRQLDPLQTVWVGRNENFVIGDEIEVEPHPMQAGVWQLVGPTPKDKRRNRG